MAPIEGIKLGFKLADLAKSQGKKFTNINKIFDVIDVLGTN